DGWVLGKIARPPQTLLLAAMPDKQHGSFWPLFRVRQCFSHSQKCGGAGTIVIRAVTNWIGSSGRANADVIVMRTHSHVFVLQHGVAAFPDRDHILGRG